MKRPVAHRIDAAADALLRQTLAEWVVDELEHDYGKDYRVELQDDERLTGEAFMVQLKGFARPRLVSDGAFVQVKMETQHVAYYVDCVREPVLLVAIDTKSRRAWWLFVQQHVDETLAGRSWREQKTVTLRVPVTQALGDLHSLSAVVRRALAYMQDKRPGSVRAAITKSVRVLEDLDPRFKVDLVAGSKSEHYTVHAKEKVDLRFELSGKPADLREAMEDLMGRGKAVELEQRNVQWSITGSDLLGSLAGKAKSIQLRRQVPLEVHVLVPNGTEEGRHLFSVSGFLVGGAVEMRFCERLGDSPLILVLGLRLPGPAGEALGLTLDAKLDFAAWCGRQIGQLPHFDRVETFFREGAGSSGLMLDGIVNGIRVFRARAQVEHLDTRSVLEFLTAGRIIAAELGLTPELPRGWPVGQSYEEMSRVVEFARILRSKGARTPFKGNLSTGVDAVGAAQLLTDYERLTVSQPLQAGGLRKEVTLLGVSVEIRGYSASLSGVLLSTSRQELFRISHTAAGGNVEWIPAPGCVLIEDYEAALVSPGTS